MGRKQLLDPDGAATGNSWNRAHTEDDEQEGFTAGLFEQQDGCPFCEYEGQLRSSRKGWKCPKCREIVIPSE